MLRCYQQDRRKGEASRRLQRQIKIKQDIKTSTTREERRENKAAVQRSVRLSGRPRSLAKKSVKVSRARTDKKLACLDIPANSYGVTVSAVKRCLAARLRSMPERAFEHVIIRNQGIRTDGTMNRRAQAPGLLITCVPGGTRKYVFLFISNIHITLLFKSISLP